MEHKTISVTIKSREGKPISDEIEIPTSLTQPDLVALVKTLSPTCELSEEVAFLVNDNPLQKDIRETLSLFALDSEKTVQIEVAESKKTRPVRRCASTLLGHKGPVLSFSEPTENAALFVSGDSRGCLVFWDLFTSSAVARFEGEHTGWLLALCASPTAEFVLSGDSKGVLALWDTRQPKRPKFFAKTQLNNRGVLSICLAGALVVVTGMDGSVQTLRPSLGVGIERVRNCKVAARAVKGCALAGPTAVFCWGDCNDLILLFLQTSEIKRFALHKNLLNCLDTLDCGTSLLVATGSDDCGIVLSSFEKKSWTLITTERLSAHSAPVISVRFSPDGKLLASCSFDKTVRVWSVASRKCVWLLRGHVAAVYDAVFTADSKKLYTVSKDHTGKSWDLLTGKLLHDFAGHDDEIFCLKLSRCNKSVFTGGKDGKIKIWKN